MSDPLPSLTSPPWTPLAKRTVALIVLGIVLFIVLQLLSAWSVVLVSLILAYLLYPITRFLDENALAFIPMKGLRRNLAVVLTFGFAVAVLAIVLLLIIPPIFFQTQELAETLPDTLLSVERRVVDELKTPITIGDNTIIPWDEMRRVTGDREPTLTNINVISTVQQAAGVLSDPVAGVASVALNILFSLTFVFIMMFYLLRDGDRFLSNTDDFIPIEYQGDVQRLIYELGIIWNAYLRGQILLGLIIGVTTGLAAAALGLPQPLVLGLLAGLLEFVPNIGPILAGIPAVLFSLIAPSTTIPGLEGLPFMLAVILTYAVIQQIEAIVVVPRVMGDSLDLHPFVVIVAVISGAALGGLLGIILAAPVTATLRLAALYLWGKLFDFDPFARMSMQIPAHHETALPSIAPTVITDPVLPESNLLRE